MSAGGGRVVGAGRFRVDRRRALEKMERFQLEDPHRYVLEWVAAAMVSGAERIDVVNDADDLRIRWSCAEPPSGDDLDAIFDHLWGVPEDARGLMLQHLGIGVLGALGLAPRWIRVDAGNGSGDVRLTVADPTETRHVPLATDELDGVRCHVREQLTATTILEALTALFQDPTEARLVQGAARWCPVTINGRRVTPPAPPPTTVLDATTAAGRLWFAVRPAPPIDLLRHGIVVAHLAVELGPFAVGGWWRADALRLNASRSGVVEDEAWQRATSAVEDAVDRILRHEVTPALAAADRTWVAWYGEGDRARVRYRATREDLLRRLAVAAILRLHQRRRSLGTLDHAVALADTAGRHHAIDDLRRERRRVGTADRPYEDDAWSDRLVFTGEAAEVVRAVLPDAPDWSRELAERAEGRRRRAEAARDPRPPVFPEPDQRTVREGSLAIAVRWRPGRAGRDGTVLVHVRIGGIPLCTTEVDGPAGRLEAIVDDPELKADAGFRDVVRDARFHAAVARLRAEATELVIERLTAAARAPTDDDVRLFTQLLARSRAPRLDHLLADADPRLAALPVLRTGAGPVDAATVAARSEWFVVPALPPWCPPAWAAAALVVPADLVPRWARWLGADPEGGAALAARVERERRLAAPRRRAILVPWPGVKVPVEADGLRGEIGWDPGAGKTAAITVLRDGVEVGVARWELALTGVVGVVDGPELEVTPAHDALTEASAFEVRVGVALAVDVLAIELWRGLREGELPPPPLLAWLAHRPLHPAAGPLPVTRRFDGRTLCVADLQALAAPRKRKLRLIRGEPGDLPGFDDAVPHGAALEELLDALAPGGWRDATPDLERAREAVARYQAQPPWTEPPALARREVRGDGWSGVALLPADDRCGLHQVTVLWRGRALATDGPRAGAGPWLVIEGRGLTPNRTFDGVSARSRLSGIDGGAWLEALVTEAVDRGVSPGRATAWLALVARLAADPAPARRALVDLVGQQPFVPRIGGAPVSLAEIAAAGDAARRVSAGTEDGPADGLYVRDVPGLAAALEATHGLRLADGTADLAVWRRGQALRQSLPRRAAVVTTALPILDRRPVPGGGEVALLGGDATPGLRIEPLVDGRALRSETLPLPVAAVAVVEGPGVEADRGFEGVVRSRAWTERVAEVRALVVAMGVRLVEELIAGRRSAERLTWAWRWLLAGDEPREGAALDAPAFPLTGGGWASLRDLQARAARDGAIAIATHLAPLPRELQPVHVSGPLRSLVERRFRVVEVRPTGRRPATGPLRPPPPREGGLGPGSSGIEVRIAGVPVLALDTPPGPMPLEGWIDDPALTPTPLWDDVVRDDAWTALLAWIAETSTRETIARATAPDPPPVLLETLIALTSGSPLRPDPDDPLLRALFRAPLIPDSTGGRVSLAAVLAEGRARRVPPDAVGEPLPGRPPFLAIDDRVRDWLATAVPVQEAEAALERETRGAGRRRMPAWRKPWIPRHAGEWREAPFEVVVWLSELLATPPQVLDRGRRVCAWPGPVPPGLTGWVDGPFDTDDAYTRAEIPPEVRREFDATVTALLQAEADAEGDRRRQAFARLRAALGDEPLSRLAAHPPWRDLAPFRDLAGRPVTLDQLVRLARERRCVVWDAPGQPASEGERGIAADAEDREHLAALLPRIPLRRRGEREADRARRDAASREKTDARRRQQVLVERVVELGGGRTADIEAAVADWVARNPDAAVDDPVEATLAAWAIASDVLAAAGRSEAELDVIAALADQLGRR